MDNEVKEKRAQTVNGNVGNNKSDIKITSVAEFLFQIRRLKEQMDDKGEIVFRGEYCLGRCLKPSIGRPNNGSETLRHEKVLELERQVFLEFKRQYYPYTDLRPQTDMDILFLAQHYGLKTRLLDWSYNPLVALYFACEKNIEDNSEKETNKKEKNEGAEKLPNGRVYYHILTGNMFDSQSNPKMPNTLDEIQKKNRDFFVVPDYMDIRYRNQKALFLFCANPEKNIEKIERGKLRSFIIEESSKKKILEELALLGYSPEFIYPTLEKLCEGINKRFEKDKQTSPSQNTNDKKKS